MEFAQLTESSPLPTFSASSLCFRFQERSISSRVDTKVATHTLRAHNTMAKKVLKMVSNSYHSVVYLYVRSLFTTVEPCAFVIVQTAFTQVMLMFITTKHT